jgi:putative NADPH-quinone reductase
MKTLMILGHPKPRSFNHGLAEAVREELRQNGHQVWFHDLYAEGFDPVMPAAELERDPMLPPLIRQHAEEVVQADGIVVIHPNWWSQPPAIVRGWTDRVLRAGHAYQFVPDGQGGARPVGLLKARVALVINTANTPQAKEEQLYGDPLQTIWCRVVFALCGVPSIRRLTFSPVITSTSEQREAWLGQARDAARRLFG